MSRQRDKEISVTLFPFLSILSCVMGVLILVIAGIAAGQVTAADASGQEEGIRIQELVAKALFVQSLLLINTDQNDPESRLAQLREELLNLQKEIERLRNLLRDVDIPEQATIKLTPGGTGTDLDATFVDCTEFAIILHPERTIVGEVPSTDESILGEFERLVKVHRQTKRVRKQDIKDSQVYRQFLADAEDERRGTVIFLIRPDGVECFNQARKVASKLGIRYGYLPIPGHGSIDFSQFRTGQ